MDVKKLGRIPDGGGWRALGRAARETTKDRTRKIGYDYVHSLVDDYSRLAYSEILPDEKGPTCAAFLTRTAAYFAARGITRIERLMTDNAWAYHLSLREVCASPTRSSSSRTAPGRTARSRASTAPWPPSGPTGRSSAATPSAPPPLPPGSSTTTLDAATAPSTDFPRSAAWHQPDGSVHLGRRRLGVAPHLLSSRAASPAPADRRPRATRGRGHGAFWTWATAPGDAPGAACSPLVMRRAHRRRMSSSERAQLSSSWTRLLSVLPPVPPPDAALFTTTVLVAFVLPPALVAVRVTV
jgi:hypothetical protein